MELHVVIEGDKDLAGQLYRQLKDAIRTGRLAAGEKLPPSRLLAEQLGLSRKTVSEAYARLSFDRLLTARVGSGTFVAEGAARGPSPAAARSLAGSAMVEHWRGMNTPLRHPAPAGSARYEYIGGAPARDLFPHADWRRCVLHALRQGTRSRGLYGDAEGLHELRDGIARHVSFSRGVRCGAADILVTNGAQQALDLIARVLVEPGSTVAMEEPGYPPARQLLGAQGAKVVGVPVDREGLVVERIPDGTRLIYVTPAHQFPLGVAMSERRRKALLARADELGAIVIEDDYDSEFRYEGRPADSLQSMDERGLVAFVGTFSKTLSPDLRLGYLVAPPAVLEAVGTAKHLTDWHTSTQAQWALAKFIADGNLNRHVRRCHAVYAARRERIVRRFADDLSPWFELLPVTAGIHMAAVCRREIDIGQLVALARRVDVGLYPLAPFFHFSPPRPGLMLGFGAIDEADIDPSLDRVRDVLLQMG
ncbi:GntR family transcriptional regulator/MocR family aminotransferase [Variovorax sp. SG517]|uniref:MocR-like pyridoxine biosynthesis transcription factor PdxR n=1 Tax=Variovorax sp. SG517 TaxID=2587117 RepID=UPI00159D1B24|nr:PLP-dependent aminotransferase family protein [Variovorax sp. SG517]NVM88049.1 GntR family transcriptional regulator/MocR family aminotransferase [Variovorax sp. SG517]